jgi:hypothetical protein
MDHAPISAADRSSVEDKRRAGRRHLIIMGILCSPGVVAVTAIVLAGIAPHMSDSASMTLAGLTILCYVLGGLAALVLTPVAFLFAVVTLFRRSVDGRTKIIMAIVLGVAVLFGWFVINHPLASH